MKKTLVQKGIHFKIIYNTLAKILNKFSNQK